jgi:hypothetical protein
MKLEQHIRIQQMGLYSSGPFTRIDLSIKQGQLVLRYERRPDTSGVRLWAITSGEFPSSIWALA